MAYDQLRREDPTRQTPMELQIRRLAHQVGAEFNATDPRIRMAISHLVNACEWVSDYVDNVEPKE